MSALTARGLCCGWGGTPVVEGLDLEVQPSTITLLAGANGAGKTTAMLTLAGAIPPLGGEIAIGAKTARAGLDVRARAGLAFVPEGRHVFGRLTVRDNLRLGRGPVDRATELFPELEPLLRKRAGTLSGGEQQMLRLARALAGGPSVLLIDELSLGLAPRVVERLLAGIRRAAESGTAVVIVEQHVRLVLGITDHACVLANGRPVLRLTGGEMHGRLPEIEAAYLSSGGEPSPPGPEPNTTSLPTRAGAIPQAKETR